MAVIARKRRVGVGPDIAADTVQSMGAGAGIGFSALLANIWTNSAQHVRVPIVINRLPAHGFTGRDVNGGPPPPLVRSGSLVRPMRATLSRSCRARVACHMLTDACLFF